MRNLKIKRVINSTYNKQFNINLKNNLKFLYSKKFNINLKVDLKIVYSNSQHSAKLGDVFKLFGVL